MTDRSSTAERRELLAKATPGPWAITLNQGSIRPVGDTRRVVFGHDGNIAHRLADWSLIVAAVNDYARHLDLEDRVTALEEALAWYGEQARLCRLIHSEGDAGRQALDADGGKRARALLTGELSHGK